MTKGKKGNAKKDFDDLLKAILKLKTLSESKKFFRDLLTVEETKEFSARWKVCQMIDKKIPYREISKQTGVSTTTVSRIAYWLKHGEGGYRLILGRMKRSSK